MVPPLQTPASAPAGPKDLRDLTLGLHQGRSGTLTNQPSVGHPTPDRDLWNIAPILGPPPTTRINVPFLDGIVIDTTITSDAGVVGQVLQELRGPAVRRGMIVGIDTEWKKLGKGNSHLTTLIQICVSIHCLIVQALHATDGQIPEDL